MKEQYIKPKIFFESFSLTQTIARNCGDTHDPYSTFGESNHYNEFDCQWIIGDGEDALILFFVDACADSWAIGDPEPGDEVEYEGMCYNNPDGGQEIFSST